MNICESENLRNRLLRISILQEKTNIEPNAANEVSRTV